MRYNGNKQYTFQISECGQINDILMSLFKN